MPTRYTLCRCPTVAEVEPCSVGPRARESPPAAGLPCAEARLLRLDRAVRPVDDDLAVSDLRRILEDPLELLVAHPFGGDASRVVGLRRGLEAAISCECGLPLISVSSAKVIFS